jgi:DNA-binding NarL/FixJ family response regulator
MNSNIATKVINLLRSQTNRSVSEEINITSKERIILENLASGKNYKSIATELNITVNTIRYHIKNIYSKLQAGSQSEAIAKAYRRGIL